MSEPTAAPPPSSEAELAALHEIRYDGLRYLYRGYRYEHFGDALSYARLDRTRPGFVPDAAFQPRWEAPWQPDSAQRAQMAPWGIVFAAGYYQYGSYRYERLADALAYARLHGALTPGA